MAVPREVKKLIDDFGRLRVGRIPDSFDEAQLQRTYIEPFFEALGWNVRDPREVVVEKRVHVRDSIKSADYCFQLDGKPQFVVETKDFRKKLDDPHFIFQTKLYGYNLPASLGVLTNFGEFRLYDAGLEPIFENPVRGAIKKFHLGCEDYVNRWDELEGTFSRQAVAAGALKELLPKARRTREKEALDRKFFERLTEWRKELATKIAWRNKQLDEYEINEAVQRIIDRIIFMRVIEDRQIEATELLLDALNRWKVEKEKKLYRYVVDKFRYLEPQYNGELFEEHKLSENLLVDDDVLRRLLESFYYPKCPYQFNKIGVEMLGTIYERFLGSKIRLTPTHQAKVEPKPEVRKAKGVYYTPKYIVDYIVENTVGELLKKCKTPAAVGKLKILDPACGSGSFLLGAFQRLIDWHEDYFNENADKISKKLAECWWDDDEGRYRLTAKFKGQILVNNIFAVDIDPQACEVTTMSLYLKILENVNAQFLMKTALLPQLDNNIKCGNSLIGSDYWEGRRTLMSVPPDEEEERRVNPFDWGEEFAVIMKAGGFDAVIGNPPYIRVDNLDDRDKGYYKNKYKSPKGKYDIYYLFIEKSLKLISYKGVFGFIIPNRFCTADSGEYLREFITQKEKSIFINSVSLLGVFEEARNYPIILIISRLESAKGGLVFKHTKTKEDLYDVSGLYNILLEELLRLPAKIFPINAKPEIVRTHVNLSLRFPKLSDALKISEGFRIPNTVEIEKGEEHLIKQYQFKRYSPVAEGTYVNVKDRSKYVSDKSGRLAGCLKDKIIFMEDALRVEASLDTSKSLCQGGVYFGTLISPVKFDLKYILGIINSRLFTVLYRHIFGGMHMGGGYLRFRTSFLNEIPIPNIDFKVQTDVARHDKMVAFVEEMQALHKRLAAAKSDADKQRLQRAIKVTDMNIDALVYELYGLTDEEIKIVEGI